MGREFGVEEIMSSNTGSTMSCVTFGRLLNYFELKYEKRKIPNLKGFVRITNYIYNVILSVCGILKILIKWI